MWYMFPALDKHYGSLEPPALWLKHFLEDFAGSEQGVVGSGLTAPQLFGFSRSAISRVRVVQPFLNLGSEMRGFNLFCSDNATVSPLIGEGGNTDEQPQQDTGKIGEDESPHPTKAGTRCWCAARSEMWMLLKLISYLFLGCLNLEVKYKTLALQSCLTWKMNIWILYNRLMNN